MSEDLLVNIDINTNQAAGKVDNLTDSLRRNTKQTKEIEKELKKLEKEFKSIATAVKKVPTAEIGKLNKEVKKSDKAMTRLGAQLDRTSGKMQRVKERTIGAESALSAMGAALVALGTIQAIDTMAGRIQNATAAILSFEKSIIPTIERTKELSILIGNRVVEAFTQVRIAVGSVGSAFKEQVALFRGVSEGTKRSTIFMVRFRDALQKIGLASQSTSTLMKELVGKVESTKEQFGRIKTLFRGVSESLEGMRKSVVVFQQAWFGTFGSSSGGAAQVNKFQMLLLNLQGRMEDLGRNSATILAKGLSLAKQGIINIGTALPGVFKQVMQLKDSFTGSFFKVFESKSRALGGKIFDLSKKFGILNGGILGLIESSAGAGVGLLGLGAIIKSTDSKILDFIGSIVQAIGILAIGFSTAGTVVIGVVGSIVSAIGGKLLAVMDKWEEKFAKVQQTTKAFEFVVRGFGKSVGEEAVGSIAFWNAQIAEMVKTTTFGAASIQKGIKILIAEGQALGLTAEQNAMVLKRAADIAAITGNNLEDVSLSFAKALGGAAGTMQTFGIFTDEATLKHSNYAHSLEEGTNAIGKNGKALLVMNSVFEQTAPIVGFAADQLNTVTGASQQLEQTQTTLAAKLGSTNDVFVQMTQIQNSFFQALVDLPSAIHNIISAVVEWGGVILKITGTLISMSLTIISIKSAFTFLDFILVKSTAATIALNFVLGVTAEKLGVNILRVTNLKTALLGLGTVLKAGVIEGMKSFVLSLVNGAKAALQFIAQMLFTQVGLTGIAIRIDMATAALLRLNAQMLLSQAAMRKRLVAAVITGSIALKEFTVTTFFTVAGLQGLAIGLYTATLSVAQFTVALLSNPLFINAVVIASSLFLVVRAFKEIRKEMTALTAVTGTNKKQVEDSIDVWERLGKLVTRVTRFFVNFSKTSVVGWMEIVVAIKMAVLGYQLAWASVTRNKEAIVKLKKESAALTLEMRNLKQVGDNAFIGMGNALEDTADAADKANVALHDMSNTLNDLTKAGRGFSESMKLGAEAMESVAVDVFGDEFDKANKKLQETKQALDNLTNIGIIKIGTSFELPTAANLEKLFKGKLNTKDDTAVLVGADEEQRQKALLEMERARAELQKLRLDFAKELGRVHKDLAINALRDNSNEIAAIKMAGSIKLADFQAQVIAQEKLGALSAKELVLKNQIVKAIKAATAAEVDRAVKKAAELVKAEKKRLNDENIKALSEQSKLLKELNRLNSSNVVGSENALAAAMDQYEIDTDILNNLRSRLLTNKELLDSTGNIKQEYQNILDIGSKAAAKKLQLALDKDSFIGQMNDALSKIKPVTIGGGIALGVIEAGFTVADKIRAAFRSVNTTLGDLFKGIDLSAFKGIFKGFDVTKLSEFGKNVKNAFSATNFSKLGKNIGDMAKNIFSPKNLKEAGIFLASSAADAVVGIADLYTKFLDPSFIQGLADMFGNLDKLPDALIKAFNNLINNLDKIIDSVVDAFSKLIDKLPAILAKILDMLPALIDSLSDVLEKLIDAIPGLVAQVLEALPGILSKLLERLPDILFKLISAIGNIIGQLISAIPGIIVQIFEALPSIIMAIIDGIMDAADSISLAVMDFMIEGIPRIIAAFIKMIPKLVVAIVKGIVNGTIRAFERFFNGFEGPTKAIQKIGKQFQEGVNNLAKKATQEAGKLFKVLDIEAATRGQDMAKQFQEAFDNGVKLMVIKFKGLFEILKDLWTGLINLLAKAWTWVYDNVIQPIADIVQKAWTWVYDNVIQPIADVVQMAWKYVYDTFIEPIITVVQKAFEWVQTNILAPLAGVVQEAFGWVATNVFEPIAKLFEPIFTAFNDGLMAFYNFISPVFEAFATAMKAFGDFIKPVFDALKVAADSLKASWQAIKDLFAGKDAGKVFNDLGTKIWTGLKSGIDSAAATFKSIGTNMWNGLKEGLKTAGTVVGDALKKLDPTNLMKKIFAIPSSAYGKGAVEKVIGLDVPFVKFAQGGVVPGNSPFAGDNLKNDKIAAMLSPGEIVIPKSVLESDPLLRQLALDLAKGKMNRFSGGLFGGGGPSLGDLDPTNGAVSDAVGGALGSVGIGTGGVLGSLAKGDISALEQSVIAAYKALIDPKAEIMKHIKEAIRSMMKLHNGGMVPGFAAGGEMPAMLQSGEFVMSRNAVGKLGKPFLEGLNSGKNTGTTVTEVELGGITVNTTQQVDQNFIRTQLMPMIKREMKEASLRGEFLISQKGIRAT